MKLKKNVVRFIGDKKSKKSQATRFTIALYLSFTDQWVGMLAKANKDNGPLIHPKVLQIISDGMAIPVDDLCEETETKILPVRA